MDIDTDQIVNIRLRNEIKVILGMKEKGIFQPLDPNKVILELVETEVDNYKSVCATRDVIYLRLLDGNKTSKYIKIKFNSRYPFAPPDIWIYNQQYKQLLKDLSEKYIGNFLPENSKNTRCLCCETITCKGNWSPSFSINTLVEEIQKSIIMVTSMSIMVLISKILDTHIHTYVPIDIYLLPEQYTGLKHHFWREKFF